MNITAFLQLLSGKKTYLTIAAIFVVLFGTWQHWWTVPDEVYIPLFAIALAFLYPPSAKVRMIPLHLQRPPRIRLSRRPRPPGCLSCSRSVRSR